MLGRDCELAKGLGVLDGAASAEKKKGQNCSGDLNSNMRSQTDIRSSPVDLLFKLPPFSASHHNYPNATRYLSWADT